MAMKSTFKNMVICLTLICIVCSALLAGVYALTKAPIDKAAADKLSSAISEVLPTTRLRTARQMFLAMLSRRLSAVSAVR